MKFDYLPVERIRPDLVAALRPGSRCIVEAPMRMGKFTRVLQLLIDEDLVPAYGQVVVLQPRRLAARLLAGWVA